MLSPSTYIAACAAIGAATTPQHSTPSAGSAHFAIRMLTLGIIHQPTHISRKRTVKKQETIHGIAAASLPRPWARRGARQAAIRARLPIVAAATTHPRGWTVRAKPPISTAFRPRIRSTDNVDWRLEHASPLRALSLVGDSSMVEQRTLTPLI